MSHSKRAVWLAVNSEHGKRLLEIAREHTRLVREMTDIPHDDKVIYEVRIEQLRQERDTIIQQFEEGQM